MVSRKTASAESSSTGATISINDQMNQLRENQHVEMEQLSGWVEKYAIDVARGQPVDQVNLADVLNAARMSIDDFESLCQRKKRRIEQAAQVAKLPVLLAEKTASMQTYSDFLTERNRRKKEFEEWELSAENACRGRQLEASRLVQECRQAETELRRTSKHAGELLRLETQLHETRRTVSDLQNKRRELENYVSERHREIQHDPTLQVGIRQNIGRGADYQIGLERAGEKISEIDQLILENELLITDFTSRLEAVYQLVLSA